MVNYNPSPNMTPADGKGGWQVSSATLSTTADGGNFKDSTNFQHQMWIEMGSTELGPTVPVGKKFALTGVKIRKNTSSSKRLRTLALSVWAKQSATTDYWIAEAIDLAGAIFPVGKFITIPNIEVPDASVLFNPGGESRLMVQLFGDPGPIDYTVTNFDVLLQSDAPVGAVIDDNDVDYTYTAHNDNLSVSFSHLDPNELIQMLKFDYGDGPEYTFKDGDVAGTRTPTHVFPTAGTYNVKLAGQNMINLPQSSFRVPNQYLETIKQVTVPAGVFAADFVFQSSYLDIDVDGGASTVDNIATIPVTYDWDWGDGTAHGTGKVASHSYNVGGTYPVKLKITNSLGQSSTKTIPIEAVDLPSAAINFTVDKNFLEVHFNPTQTQGTFVWAFGDGKTSNVVAPTNFYDTPGNYNVTLTWTDSAVGATPVSITKEIAVKAVATPITDISDALRLEVTAPRVVGVFYNEIENPNGELGGYGWVTPTATGTMKGSATDTEPDDKGQSGWKLIFKSGGNAAQNFSTEKVRVNASQWVNITYQVPYIDGYYRQSIRWYDSAGALISETALTPYNQASGSAKRMQANVQAPLNTVYMDANFYHYSSTTGANPVPNALMHLRRVMLVAANANSTALTNLAYTDANNWLDIMDSSFEIGIMRAELDIGVLKTRVRNGKLDPSRFQVIQPGQAIRLRAATLDDAGNTVWENVYTGEVNKALVTYDRFDVMEVPGAEGQSAVLLATNLVRNPGLGVDASTYTGNNATALRVTTWNSAASTSAGSLEITPNVAGNNDTFAAVDGGALAIRLGMVVGKTYTFSADCQVVTAQTGTLSPRARKIVAFVKAPSTGANYVETTSIQALNVAGTVSHLTTTFTIPADATEAFIRIYNGSSVAAEKVRYDALILTEGDFDQNFFSGATPDTNELDYAWTGTAHASTSTMTQKAIPSTPTTFVAVDDDARTVIDITAIDKVRDMGIQGESRGLHRVVDLPFILEGKGIPYIVNGSSDQVTSAQVVSINENAKLIDQVAITRDTEKSYAFVNRNNVFVAFDPVAVPTGIVGTFDEADYTDIDVDFDTDNCINSVGVTWLRAVAGQNSEEIKYGPYVDQASIDTWGRHHKEFVIHGIVESAQNIADYAAAVLTANSIPVVTIHSLAFQISTAEDLSKDKALVDLYDLVKAKYAHSGIDRNLRVSEIKHIIDTSNGWRMTVGFQAEGIVASPQETPSPPASIPASKQVGQLTTGTHVVGTVKTTHVNFPVAYPAGTTPRVFLMVQVSATPDAYQYAVNAVTNTGFDIMSVRSAGTTGLNFAWFADVDT